MAQEYKENCNKESNKEIASEMQLNLISCIRNNKEFGEFEPIYKLSLQTRKAMKKYQESNSLTDIMDARRDCKNLTDVEEIKDKIENSKSNLNFKFNETCYVNCVLGLALTKSFEEVENDIKKAQVIF